ncbi:MAG: TfoX/Sxy family protein [Desulfobacterales bacterium]|jgi:TfoX/Sxy family transcriptional regulator of competence genes|nr:TfoX/Sxy family protein [Desulfobacterales bacterium]
MAYDAGLAQRIEEALEDTAGFEEKKMFGGICYLVSGNMACGVYKDYLIVRVGPDAYKNALARPYAREFDITGRPMKGWVMVSEQGYDDDAALYAWIRMGLDFAGSLPPK